jgi:mannose-1-phosphate guanylyltransferase
MKIVIVILSGGSGSRLWPVSREEHPKPFIKLNDGQSFLQKTFLRAAKQSNVVEIITVTNQSLIYLTLNDYQDLNHSNIKNSFILETFGRNTAPAIACSALYCADEYKEDDVVMVVLPADHLIEDHIAFEVALGNAINYAASGQLVTFGINPEYPETSYGYIKAKNNKVLSFIEKPTKNKAESYLLEGGYYWNSGMFCFKPTALISEMKMYCPDILNNVKQCLNLSKTKKILDQNCILLDENASKKIPSESIDYALLEKSKNVSVVPCSIGWSDVGSWLALTDLIEPDQDQNRVKGDVILLDSKNSSIYASDRTVGVIGLNNIIVAETPDAVLVMDKSKVQDVKNVFNNLKSSNHVTYRSHLETFRPWGSFKILHEGLSFKVKSIKLNPLQKISLQKHNHRAEHWVVVKGEAKIKNNDIFLTLKENESTFIAQGNIHQLINPTNEVLEIIEVQSGAYVGEDDIERFEDHYDRI